MYLTASRDFKHPSQQKSMADMGYKDMPPGGTTAKLERRRTPPNAVIFAPFSAFSRHVFCSPKALAKSDDVCDGVVEAVFPHSIFSQGEKLQ